MSCVGLIFAVGQLYDKLIQMRVAAQFVPMCSLKLNLQDTWNRGQVSAGRSKVLYDERDACAF